MNRIRNVVCTHGFWSHAAGMYLIKRRLERRYGLRVLLFSYASVRGTLDENAAALAAFMREQELESTHIIGHSLGGVIALRMLANDPDAPPGRLVCMGSPLCGSRAAALLNERVWGERIIGDSLKSGVIRSAANEWGRQVCARRDVGIIAGTVPLGMGKLVARFDEPNDGTVALSETYLDGARDHLIIQVNHSGMLVSHEVVDQAAAFLKHGEFLRDRGRDS